MVNAVLSPVSIPLPNSTPPTSRNVRSFWSKRKPPLEATGGFLYSPITRPYIIEMAYGHDAVEPYRRSFTWAWDILVDRYLAGRRIERVLSLCCGFGLSERILAPRLPYLTECRALDIAPGAINAARRLAGDAGIRNIRYEVADLNAFAWESDRYDLVIANGALHHLSNLEDVLSGVRKALKRDGLFYSCECVGPNYQDHSPRQLELINSTAFLVPPELRARTGLKWARHPRLFRALTRLHLAAARQNQPHWARWKNVAARAARAVVRRPAFDFGVVHISPKSHLLRSDPSECVRSSEILPIVRRLFPSVELHPMGGGLLEFALDAKFYENFDGSNERHRRDFEFVCDAERHYMATGEIGSDFAILIAQRD
jgi:SAM-dependent methyltransferase